MLIRCVWLFALVLVIAGFRGTAFAGEVEDDDGDRGSEVFSIDHFVPHVSTVPATSGELVKLFVRERFHHPSHKVVLFVHGNTIGSIPAFDLDFKDFDWMEFLARSGYDTFAMDSTGYDFSPMPEMDNPCNTSTAQQKAFLIPKPLPTTCNPSYPFVLTTAQSDWDEVDAVVDYIRGATARGKSHYHRLVLWRIPCRWLRGSPSGKSR